MRTSADFYRIQPIFTQICCFRKFCTYRYSKCAKYSYRYRTCSKFSFRFNRSEISRYTLLGTSLEQKLRPFQEKSVLKCSVLCVHTQLCSRFYLEKVNCGVDFMCTSIQVFMKTRPVCLSILHYPSVHVDKLYRVVTKMYKLRISNRFPFYFPRGKKRKCPQILEAGALAGCPTGIWRRRCPRAAPRPLCTRGSCWRDRRAAIITRRPAPQPAAPRKQQR